MSRKYTIRFAPKLAINFYLPARLAPGAQGLFDFLLYAQTRNWKLFLVLLFPAFFVFVGTDFGSSQLLWLYGFVVLMLFFQIMLRLLGKSDFLPTVSYDLLLLTYTSAVAISLLLAVVSEQNTFPLWGGKSFRIISGLSLIAYWFLYYLTNIFGRQQGMLRRSIELIGFSALLSLVWTGVVSWLDPVVTFGYGVTEPIIMLMPVWLWLSLSAPRLRMLFGINFFASIILLFKYPSPAAILALVVSFAVQAVLLLIANRKNFNKKLQSLAKDFDGYGDRKLSLGKVLSNNADIVVTGYSVIAVLAGVIWMLAQRGTISFPLLDRGITGMNALSGLQAIVFGSGLSGQGGSLLTELVRSYGLLSFLVFAILMLILLRDLLTILRTKQTEEIRGYVFSVIGFISASVVFFLLSWTSELHLILFWIWFGFGGVLRSRLLEKEMLNYTNELSNFDKIASKPARRMFEIARLLGVLLLLLGILYFFNLLYSIQAFIS